MSRPTVSGLLPNLALNLPALRAGRLTPRHQAAAARRREVRTRAKSRFVAPVPKKARSSRSSEILGSPASILATRDWLEWSLLARAAWVTPSSWRRVRNARLTARRISTRAASSADSARKSAAFPVFHPAASRRFRFFASISITSRGSIILREPSPTVLNDSHRRLLRGLLKDIGHHDCVWIQAADDSPRLPGVDHAKLMTARADPRHRARMRHPKAVTLLEASEQHTSLDAPRLRTAES